MAGGREYKKPGGGGAGPDAGDADGGGGRDPRMLMSMRMRSRRENQEEDAAAPTQDAEVAKLLESGNQDPQAYAKAIAASKQPRNALLGDIKDKLGPEFADQVSEALVAIELKKGGGEDKDAAGGKAKDKDGGGASADAKDPTAINAKAGGEDLGAEGSVDPTQDKAKLSVSGKEDGVSASGGIEEDSGKPTVSGSVSDGDVKASGSYTDDKDHSASVSANHKFGKELSASASASDTEKADKDPTKPASDTEAASLGGKFQDGKFSANAEVDVNDQNGKVSETEKASAKYDGDTVGGSAEVDVNEQGGKVTETVKGSADVKLVGGKLQAELTGSVTEGDVNKDAPKYNLGGKVTLTVGEHAALVATGAMDDKGGLDLSIDFDAYKDKINSAADVADDKKQKLVDFYVEYKGGDGQPDQVTGGLKMNF